MLCKLTGRISIFCNCRFEPPYLMYVFSLYMYRKFCSLKESQHPHVRQQQATLDSHRKNTCNEFFIDILVYHTGWLCYYSLHSIHSWWNLTYFHAARCPQSSTISIDYIGNCDNFWFNYSPFRMAYPFHDTSTRKLSLGLAHCSWVLLCLNLYITCCLLLCS